jgi:hypothetical protein
MKQILFLATTGADAPLIYLFPSKIVLLLTHDFDETSETNKSYK